MPRFTNFFFKFFSTYKLYKQFYLLQPPPPSSYPSFFPYVFIRRSHSRAHGRVVKTLDSRHRRLGCACYIQKPGQAFNPQRLCPPSSNGYQVKRLFVLFEWLQLQKIALHSTEGDETVNKFQYLGVINIKSAEQTGTSRL